MIWITLFALVAFLIGAVEEGIVEAFFLAAVAGLIGFLVAMIVGTIAYSGTHHETTRPVTLVNLDDTTSVQGSFFLGSGSVDGYPAFVWYESDGDNSYVRKYIDADESTVHYLLHGGVPHYTKRMSVPDNNSFMNPWGVNVGAGDAYAEHYDFYVPRGSITQSFSLDNK